MIRATLFDWQWRHSIYGWFATFIRIWNERNGKMKVFRERAAMTDPASNDTDEEVLTSKKVRGNKQHLMTQSFWCFHKQANNKHPWQRMGSMRGSNKMESERKKVVVADDLFAKERDLKQIRHQFIIYICHHLLLLLTIGKTENKNAVTTTVWRTIFHWNRAAVFGEKLSHHVIYVVYRTCESAFK